MSKNREGVLKNCENAPESDRPILLFMCEPAARTLEEMPRASSRARYFGAQRAKLRLEQVGNTRWDKTLAVLRTDLEDANGPMKIEHQCCFLHFWWAFATTAQTKTTRRQPTKTIHILR